MPGGRTRVGSRCACSRLYAEYEVSDTPRLYPSARSGSLRSKRDFTIPAVEINIVITAIKQTAYPYAWAILFDVAIRCSPGQMRTRRGLQLFCQHGRFGYGLVTHIRATDICRRFPFSCSPPVE